jgi:heme exporter protein C
MFYAPIPSTSVRSANELPTSVRGSEITVGGFIASMESYGETEDTDAIIRYNFTVADFSDYARYLEASHAGEVRDQWWTVRPIMVKVYTGGLLTPYLTVGPGSNVSVTGELEFGDINPPSDTFGIILTCESSYDVVELDSPAAFTVMTSPISQKIFYFHMPSAWVSYLGFFFTLVFGARYLQTRDLKYDRIAASSAEIGVLFATLAILTGPMWAKEEWGVYWRWDDTKLVTTFVMWLVYIGYLMLRAAVSDRNVKARTSAVYGVLGFVTMPMSLLSSRIAPLIRSSHPQVIASGSGWLSPEAGITIAVAVLAFTLLFITMLIKRVEVEEAEDELEELKRIVGGEE